MLPIVKDYLKGWSEMLRYAGYDTDGVRFTEYLAVVSLEEVTPLSLGNLFP